LFVARKFQVPESSRAAAQAAVMNLRMAMAQCVGLRVAPRVKKVPAVRRRLPVTMLPAPSQPVIIRHASQNLGSPHNEAQPARSRPV
jgi:hypothetical protein